MVDRLGAALAAVGRGVARAAPPLFRDVVGLAAVASISYGAWLLHPAAGFMTGGGLVLAGVILTARKRES